MSRRHRTSGLLPMAAALLCALACAGARASEAHAAAPTQAANEKPADAPKAERKIAALNTLDDLREKLSQRIGATKAVDRKNLLVMQVAQPAGNDLRVSAQPASAGASVTSAASAKAHLAKASPSASSAAHLGSHGTRTMRATRTARTPAGDAPWSYGGESGPQAWGAMKPDFSTCNTGKRQSPIDIREGIAVELEAIEFDYRKDSSFSVIDNGHTVQVDVSPGNAIRVLGRRYELQQFHFHRPSEERIGGRQFDMVVHLEHQDAEGRLATIAVLLERGSVQPIVQTIWNNLPLEKGEAQPARATLDLNALLPKDRRYYTYMGSLTTPPCSEGVLWMVMQQPVNVSAEQIDIFARLYPMNARPVQDAAGRLIKQSN